MIVTCPTFLLFFSYNPARFYIPFGLLFISLIMFYYWQKARKIKRQGEIELEHAEEERRSLTLEYGEKHSSNQALNKRLQRFATLKDVTEALSSTLSLPEISELIIEQASKVINKNGLYLLFLIDKRRESMSLAAQKKISDSADIKFKKKGDIFNRWVLRQKQPLIVTDSQKDFRFNLEKEDEATRQVKSLIIAPVISERRIIGLLRINSKEPYTFSSDDLRLLDIISGLAYSAIENALLFQMAEELAITDGLTSLYVQRYFKERLAVECEKAKMAEVPLVLLMCDLDWFKEYNDKYGHTAGDILLKRIAKILKTKIRDNKLIARYGGEEFAIILPERDKKQGMAVAENIRKAIASEPFILRRKTTRITISIGVVVFPKDALNAQELIRQADIALYQAKARGRNRVCSI